MDQDTYEMRKFVQTVDKMKVRLQDVIEAIDSAGAETEHYYNTKTEKVLTVSDGVVKGDIDEELTEDTGKKFAIDYIPLPQQYDINEYLMIEEFICELPEERNQAILERAVRRKDAFRRFKEKLHDLGLEQSWRQYRDEVYEGIAREWCRQYKIDIE